MLSSAVWDRLARIHAIWGLGQIARGDGQGRTPGLGSAFERLLSDGDPEIRAQAARVVGEARERASLDELIGLLSDPSPRVQFFAAIALGKLGRAEAAAPL
ncbi:MAG: HEAT repeat domain-containing protein, partial [Mycobacteriaceae bacterium]